MGTWHPDIFLCYLVSTESRYTKRLHGMRILKGACCVLQKLLIWSLRMSGPLRPILWQISSVHESGRSHKLESQYKVPKLWTPMSHPIEPGGTITKLRPPQVLDVLMISNVPESSQLTIVRVQAEGSPVKASVLTQLAIFSISSKSSVSSFSIFLLKCS